MELADLKGGDPASALKTLLENRKIEFPAKAPPFSTPAYPEAEWSDEQKRARDAFQRQSKLLKKLRGVADDALDYTNDHGESCLALGFPLVSIPPSGEEKGQRGSSRVLAPLLLLPLDLQVRTASRSGVTLDCAGEGADLLVANPALIAWLERQTGKLIGDVYLDDDATDPWREVSDLLKQIGVLMDLPSATEFNADTVLEAVPLLEKLPKGVQVLPSAVLGLFPLSNQSLLRDTRWMMENPEMLQEPVSAFLNPQTLHENEQAVEAGDETAVVVQNRDFSAEWLVSSADPCQANAVLSSREAKALVVHGPPGTGKSQTILNMVADHLARGERVLFVCDKRTALDVVKYRLDAVGLGDFCGVVHDPSGDRKDFYMGLRRKLENLADSPPVRDPRPQLTSTNEQLAAIHSELEGYRKKLHTAGDGAGSFHELMGQWLSHSSKPDLPTLPAGTNLMPAGVEGASTTIDEVCRRAGRAAYAVNPFRGLLGIRLPDLLSRSESDVRVSLEAIHRSAGEVDSVRPSSWVGSFDAAHSISDQSAQRAQLASDIRSLVKDHNGDFLRVVATLPGAQRAELVAEGADVNHWLAQICEEPLDRTHLSGARSAGAVSLAVANQHLTALRAWEEVAGSFFKRLFAGSAKKVATEALKPLGLGLEGGWEQGLRFYQGLKHRLLVADWLARASGLTDATLLDDASLQAQAFMAQTAWSVESGLDLIGSEQALGEIVHDKASLEALSQALENEARWGQQLVELGKKVSESGLFVSNTLELLVPKWIEEPAQTMTADWLDRAASLEDIVRLKHTLSEMSSEMGEAVEQLIVGGHDAEVTLSTLRRQAVENVLRETLKQDPELATIDGERIESAFDRFAELSQEKLDLVAEYVRFLWLHHQKGRLLASTGTQLNKVGSGLRQRLYVRGKKALKLRQMLATGAEVEGGDPIYDLCPVWMASPSTVAQIFPRHAIFDVVIFDEASQCRLEEALPVLMRGHRVVIAGDQKQLPPTRFFESALADSGDGDAETAEELFYQQQQDAEDLLTAALNLDVREAYLDVHYRSRNEALIGFSNEQYYGSRLQPIPGHPRNKALNTPIRVHRVDGVYAERTNAKEAEAAVNLISELLLEETPPSIGVACFNLTQKELIQDALAQRVERDADFARRYEEAKKRRGRDSFEGLFVKNLENVQGDERDVIIISTTFGPDAAGKFRRNFGALSQREGGRRLNVLVTRARDAVHVLTSIPVSEYASIEPAPPGQIPNGRLQLYAYLKYAERLAAVFAEYQNDLEKMQRDAKPEIMHWETATPSPIATAIGETMLAKHNAGSHVHWGNDGFCVDVACIHPVMPADVTVGVLTDFSRFHKTPDPIEWDIFRTRVLRSQGWELQRVWSPVLFRRADEVIRKVKDAHDRQSESPEKKQRVESPPAS